MNKLDTALYGLRNSIAPEIYPYYQAFGEIVNYLESFLEDQEEDDDTTGEFYGFIEDLTQLFKELADDHIGHNWENIIMEYSNTIEWDNYQDEDGHYYPLGSVWYCRLEWMKESGNKDYSMLADKIEKDLIIIMEELEEFIKVKP